MKTIAITNLLPFYVTNSKDTPSTLRSQLLKTLTNKSQQTKESSSKSLVEPANSDINIVPRPLFLTYSTLDCPIIGFPSGFFCSKTEIANQIRHGFKNKGIFPIFYNCRRVREWTERLRNVFECRQWNDVFLKNTGAYSDYKAMNKLAFEEIKKIYNKENNDALWVCDPEYWLVPQMARDKLNCVIGVTITVPFPDIDIFRSLPSPGDILKSLLNSDYIEFQDRIYLQNFVKCCGVFLRAATYFEEEEKIFFGDREIRLGVNKMGIDSDKIKKILDHANCKKRIEKYKKKIGDKKLIVSVIKRGDTVTATSVLLAYEALLSKSDNVALFLIEIGEEMPDYEAMNENKRLIDFIEINHQSSHIEVFYPVDDFAFYALLSSGDIGLMIDERDSIGKNALEFLACGGDKKLVISKFATYSREMITVNPKDFMEISTVLHQIITGKEKKENTFDIDKYTPKKWVDQFTNILHEQKITHFKTSSDTSQILEKYKTAKKRLICLDYDGTLTKLVKDSNKATPDDTLVALLEKLTSDEKNEVYIITGRTKDNMDAYIKNPKIKISAEHGHYIKDKTWSKAETNYSWIEPGLEIMQFFVDRTPGSIIERKESAICFHYRNCDEYVAKVQSKALKSALCKVFDERIIDGNRIIEMKCKETHKGCALRKIVRKEHDFIFLAGDDTTDEDMFREISDDKVFSVKVGDKKTKAKFEVKDVSEMRGLLSKMAEL